MKAKLQKWPSKTVRERIESASPADVEAVLAKRDRSIDDMLPLLSTAAEAYLEPMAAEAQRLTRWHFGRTIGLYVPLYLSNVCGADCTYCGYAVRSGNKEKRITLNEDEIRRECETLAGMGFQNVLLLTGEAPKAVPVDYIVRGTEIALEYFSSVSIEVYSLDEADYARMTALGLEGVTLYMETYDRETYADVHLLGDKADYDYRLDAIERAGRAGARRLSVGALLGLYDWRVDGFWTALHAHYLEKACWQSAVAVSFPRILHAPERFPLARMVTDKQLVQLMLATRLVLPEAGFNLSTRERPAFRDKLIPLGVTMMSAGSSTRPGGYGLHGEETLEQFEIEDHRSAAEICNVIRAAGYEPVWKDFDRAFDAPVS